MRQRRKHPHELFDELGTDENEDETQNERDNDSVQEDFLLVDPRHSECGNDNDEDEDVVQRKRVFREVAGKILGGKLGTVPEVGQHAEKDGERDIKGRPPSGFRNGRLVCLAHVSQQIEGNETDYDDAEDCPLPRFDMHLGSDRCGICT